MRDSKNMTACCDEPAELTVEQRHAALRTVCCHATDAADATDLAMMLGVHPSQDEDSSLPANLSPFV
jgi:hypothetical protein